MIGRYGLNKVVETLLEAALKIRFHTDVILEPDYKEVLRKTVLHNLWVMYHPLANFAEGMTYLRMGLQYDGPTYNYNQALDSLNLPRDIRPDYPVEPSQPSFYLSTCNPSQVVDQIRDIHLAQMLFRQKTESVYNRWMTLGSPDGPDPKEYLRERK